MVLASLGLLRGVTADSSILLISTYPVAWGISADLKKGSGKGMFSDQALT